MDEDGVLYLASRGGGVMALTSEHAKPLWRVHVGAIFEASGVLDKNAFYIGDLDGVMHAFEKATGKQRWSYQAEGEILTQPALVNDMVVFATSSNLVVALSIDSGELKWRYREDPPGDLTIRGVSAPKIEAGRVIVGFSKGVVVAIDLQTGQLQWRQTVGREGRYLDVDNTPLIHDRHIIVASVAGPVAAYSLEGKLLWLNDRLQTQLGVIADTGHLYVATFDGKAFCLNAEDGKEIWQTVFSDEILATTTPIIQGEDIIFGTSNGYLVVVDRRDGKLIWKYKIGERVSGDLLALPNGFIAMDGRQRMFRFQRYGGNKPFLEKSTNQ
jgi:outer membrane protein assembly factor BamB